LCLSGFSHQEARDNWFPPSLTDRLKTIEEGLASLGTSLTATSATLIAGFQQLIVQAKREEMQLSHLSGTKFGRLASLLTLHMLPESVFVQTEEEEQHGETIPNCQWLSVAEDHVDNISVCEDWFRVNFSLSGQLKQIATAKTQETLLNCEISGDVNGVQVTVGCGPWRVL
jgi:hypothetical protein